MKGGWVDANGKLWGRWNVVDASSLILVAVLALGVMVVQSGFHVTSGQMVERESDITIFVQMGNVKTLDQTFLKAGEKTAITIRNQPRGEVKITHVELSPYQVTLMSPQGKPVGTPDLAEPNSYNLSIRLRDHALVTQDGYVTEGVKVKVGLPIELEGFKYRLMGKIVDVQEVKS